MSTKKEEVKATSVEETKVEEVKPVETVIEPTETEMTKEGMLASETSLVKEWKEEEGEKYTLGVDPSWKEETKEISFYDDANREVSEEEATFLTDELITKIKNSHVYNEVMSYKKQLVIKYGDLEVVYSNEKAKELLK